MDENKLKILRQRAKVLANPLETTPLNKDYLEVTVFLINNEKYALESTYIREVWPSPDITPLPGTPPFVCGLINIRRQILSVINLQVLFDLPIKNSTPKKSVIIINNQEQEYGILIDEILETNRIDSSLLQNQIPSLNGIGQEVLKGVTPEPIIVLSGHKLLTHERLVINE